MNTAEDRSSRSHYTEHYGGKPFAIERCIFKTRRINPLLDIEVWIFLRKTRRINPLLAIEARIFLRKTRRITMKRNKILSLLLSVSMLTALTACGSQGSDTPAASTDAASTAAATESAVFSGGVILRITIRFIKILELRKH